MLGFMDSFRPLFLSRKADIVLYPSVELAETTLNLSRGRLGRFLVVAPVEGSVTFIVSFIVRVVSLFTFFSFFLLFNKLPIITRVLREVFR